MTDLTIVPTWNAAINRLERNEFATGGADGNMNIAPRQLAENVFWLKADIDGKLTTLTEYNTTQDTAISGKASAADVNTKNGLQDTAIGQNATAISVLSTTVVGHTEAITALEDADNGVPNFYTDTTVTDAANVVITVDGTLKRSTKPPPASLVVGKGDGQVAAYDAQGGLGVQGYVQAGTGAPKIGYKKIVAALGSTSGTYEYDHGLDASKVLSATAKADHEGVSYFAGNGVNNNFVFNIRITATKVTIQLGQSSSFFNKPCVILITYEV